VKGALSGIRVVEMGSTVAGPFCARLFADFGAEVVKIEDPGGDTIRSMGEMVDGQSLYAASLMRNKSLVALDLRIERDRAVARRLIDKADVLVENFRPGVMERWGMGYDDLAATNPGLVMVRISGFGQSGPYSQRAGYGVIGEAVSGLRAIIGDPDRPPARVGTPLTDYITGLYAAFGAMAALEERHESGRGQMIDAALSESAFTMMESFVPAYARLGIVPRRAGARFPGAAPNNLYQAIDGVYVHIAAFGEPVFRRLCEAMGQPGLAADERFANGTQRVRYVDALDLVVGAWAGALTGEDVEQRLLEAGVPASRIFNLPEIFADPHFRERGMLVRTQHAAIGEVTLTGPVPRLSRTPGEVRHAGGCIGTDTRRTLANWAGLTDAEIDDIVGAAGVDVA